MAYTKTVWVDDDGSLTVGTPYNAERMNNIESGVEDCDRDLDYECRHDASSQSAEGTGNLEWTHTPVDRPQGVVVLVVQNGTAADQVSEVTYGGVKMVEVPGSPLLHSLGAEDAAIHAFYLGSQVKTGARTVKVVTSGANAKRAVCNTVTSKADFLTCQALNSVDGESSPLNEVLNGSGPTIRTGTAGVAYGALQGGWDAVSGFSINWGIQDFTHDFGTQVAGWGHVEPSEVLEEKTFVRWKSLESGKPYGWVSVLMRPVRDYGRQTSLPSSMAVGDMLSFLADETNGIVWRLEYDGTGEYPWKKVGGPALFEEVAAPEETNTTTYTNLKTEGPKVTTPLKGDYYISFGFGGWGVAGNATLAMSLSIGGAAAGDADWVRCDNRPESSAEEKMVMRKCKKIGLSASSAILAKYRMGAGTGGFEKRWIEIDPIRVG